MAPLSAANQNWTRAKVLEEVGDDCDPEEGSACEKNGVNGTCLNGYCLTNGPGCIRDIDCYDGNDCTIERCQDGRCVADYPELDCELNGREGECNQGKCTLNVELACSKDKDCEPVAVPCVNTYCEEGMCTKEEEPEGSACTMNSGAPGICDDENVCVFDEETAISGAKRCRMAWVRRGYRRVKREKCSKGLRYTIDNERLQKQREKIRSTVEKEVRYDTHVGLIQLADGGYNINITNARKREDIRGLVDPSFIAFSLASFTAKTNWKSRNLNTWLSVLREGWYIPTHGSRTAIRKGKAASALGRWGVVNIQVYRKWLEKNYKPLPVPTDD